MSKQSNHSRQDINDLSVNVGLPKIGSNKTQLESIEDSRHEDSIYADMPQKPKGLRNSSEDSTRTRSDHKKAAALKSSSVGGQSNK